MLSLPMSILQSFWTSAMAKRNSPIVEFFVLHHLHSWMPLLAADSPGSEEEPPIIFPSNSAHNGRFEQNLKGK
jgi:hypothetical protein